MPLRCETCGQCHTRKGGCPLTEQQKALTRARDALVRIKEIAYAMPHSDERTRLIMLAGNGLPEEGLLP